MTQEPWCFHPDQVARLTPWQAEFYLGLAGELGRAAEGKAGPGPVDDPFAGGLPPRSEFVAKMRASDGGTAEHWSAVYDRLEAEMTARGDQPA